MQDGMRRMYREQEDVYYYITLMNENYAHPAMPEGASVAADIIKGMYVFKRGAANAPKKVRLLGAGTILNEVIHAAQLLKDDWGVESDIYSAPSFTELAREGYAIERENLLKPAAPRKLSHVEALLMDSDAPVIAATDYMRAVAEQIRAFVPARYTVLGTDGFGRSDTREQLRHFFEVNRYWVTVSALKALADEGVIEYDTVAKAIAKYQLDAGKPAPWTV
jgi:pyruvate dehydrogenase E1 component